MMAMGTFSCEPSCDCQCSPSPCRNGQSHPEAITRQHFPNGCREGRQTEAPNRSACRINAGRETSSLGTIETARSFFLALMYLDEGGARWKDCGKGQEESADGRAEPVGNQLGQAV